MVRPLAAKNDGEDTPRFSDPHQIDRNCDDLEGTFRVTQIPEFLEALARQACMGQ